MKTSVTAVLILCSCIARADLDIREITSDKAKQLGWKVEVEEEEDYVRFNVQPPAILLSQGRTAHLSVWQDRTLITSCILGLHKRREGDRYEFAVSKKYLTGSDFSIGQDPVKINGESYRMHLGKIFSAQKKRSGPKQGPEREK